MTAFAPVARRPALAAVATIYPKVGNVLRVPLRRTAPGGPNRCEQHPERQFIVWFNRMTAARPGFPQQIRSILLVTGQPLCESCRRRLLHHLSRYQLAGKLRLRTTGPATCGCGGVCGCGNQATLPDQHKDAHRRSLLDFILANQHDLARVPPSYWINMSGWSWQPDEEELSGEMVNLDRHEGFIGGLTSEGHTLKKHVNGSALTRFASRKTAEDLIGRALDNAKVRVVIPNWLKGRADAQVEIKHKFPGVIGTTRGTAANGIVVILIKNAAIQPEGYQILTAYPELLAAKAPTVSTSIRAVGLTNEG